MTITQTQANRLGVRGVHGTSLCSIAHVNDLYVVTYEDGSTEVIFDFEGLPNATRGLYCIIEPLNLHAIEAVQEHISVKEYNQLLATLNGIEKNNK